MSLQPPTVVNMHFPGQESGPEPISKTEFHQRYPRFRKYRKMATTVVTLGMYKGYHRDTIALYNVKLTHKRPKIFSMLNDEHSKTRSGVKERRMQNITDVSVLATGLFVTSLAFSPDAFAKPVAEHTPVIENLFDSSSGSSANQSPSPSLVISHDTATTTLPSPGATFRPAPTVAVPTTNAPAAATAGTLDLANCVVASHLVASGETSRNIEIAMNNGIPGMGDPQADAILKQYWPGDNGGNTHPELIKAGTTYNYRNCDGQ